MSNSTHEVSVVPIVLEKHPNADSLSIVNVFGGYTCVVRTQDWQGLQHGAYIPPDSLVDTSRPEFNFLLEHARADGKHRVKAKKLRGIVSFGLMVPTPEHAKIGDNLATHFGVEHYEPPLPGEQKAGLQTGGEVATPPSIFAPKYDLDTFRKYHHLFIPGEKVWATEKIHGCSARYVFQDGVMHCGSRGEWKKEYPSYEHITMDWLRERMVNAETGGIDEAKVKETFDKIHNKPKPRNLWWTALDATYGLEDWCREHEGYCVYGEVFGQVQSLRYGHTNDKPISFATFDILHKGLWLNAQDARDVGYSLPWVPFLGIYDYEFERITSLSDGPSTYPGANHYREGCVVKPVIERNDPHIGRICLKCVGATYLEKDK